MQEQKRVHGEEYKKLLEEVNKLRSEKEQQQKLLAQSLLLSEDARVEASMKHEITRLTNDNLVGLQTSPLLVYISKQGSTTSSFSVAQNKHSDFLEKSEVQ